MANGLAGERKQRKHQVVDGKLAEAGLITRHEVHNDAEKKDLQHLRR